MNITPASVDPEYAWLKEYRRLSTRTAGVEFKKEDRRRTTHGQAPVISDRRKNIPNAPEKVIHLGMLGVVLQCIGLLWLLSAAGFTIPWYSIIPMAIMIAGGVFIVKATIHDKYRTERETFQ